MSVEEAVGTGFLGIFARRTLGDKDRAEVGRVLGRLLPDMKDGAGKWAKETKFADLAPGVQSLVLFARAVVGAGWGEAGGEGKKELVILDEPFAFMETDQIERCRGLLRELGGKVAVVWVGHWEGERPWREEEGKFIKLAAGKVVDRSVE